MGGGAGWFALDEADTAGHAPAGTLGAHGRVDNRAGGFGLRRSAAGASGQEWGWRNQSDLIADGFQSAREFARGALGIAAVEEIATALLILDPLLSQNMPGNEGHSMCHRHSSLLQPAPLRDPKE